MVAKAERPESSEIVLQFSERLNLAVTKHHKAKPNFQVESPKPCPDPFTNSQVSNT